MTIACYRHQCAQTVQSFVDQLGLPKEKYFLSFQSRLGRDPWLQPYTDKTIEKHAEEGYKKIKVICPAFTTDCLETLEEIAMEGKEIFEEAGGEHFEHIPRDVFKMFSTCFFEDFFSFHCNFF